MGKKFNFGKPKIGEGKHLNTFPLWEQSQNEEAKEPNRSHWQRPEFGSVFLGE